MTESAQIRVWDPLIRFFHWALVSAFTIAYITEDNYLTIHSWAGYLIILLLCIRFVWGFTGTPYARFSNFSYSPREIIQFIKDTLGLKAKRYLGHNPAGAVMIFLLMFSLFITTLSGILLLGAEEQAGPVAAWFTQAESIWADPLEQVHEFFANFTLALIFIHLAGVLIESFIHKENLASAMITGLKTKEPEEQS
ncbi:MAG: cytochrome b/b6 domain-containing protein [Xanthomonadales bacterium]|nr:cytochrome b/b6 domain-containing protein [Xanthomonadales bacterium]